MPLLTVKEKSQLRERGAQGDLLGKVYSDFRDELDYLYRTVSGLQSVVAQLQTGASSPIRLENLSSQVDGINVLFTCAHPYATGTVKIFIDGVLQTYVAGYLTETSPALGTFTVSAAPLSGQIVAVEYTQG